MKVKVVVNNYAVGRHTKSSGLSHFDGSFVAVAHLATKYFQNQRAGYREGVIIVTVPPHGFYAGIVELNEGDKLTGEFKSRREGETPRKHEEAVGRAKMPAVSAELAIYSSATLAEDGDNDLDPTEGNWEVVSINASPLDGPQPIEPGVLLANHFGLDGGTKTNMSDQELVAALSVSVPFWADKTNASSDEVQIALEVREATSNA